MNDPLCCGKSFPILKIQNVEGEELEWVVREGEDEETQTQRKTAEEERDGDGRQGGGGFERRGGRGSKIEPKNFGAGKRVSLLHFFPLVGTPKRSLFLSCRVRVVLLVSFPSGESEKRCHIFAAEREGSGETSKKEVGAKESHMGSWKYLSEACFPLIIRA